MLAGFGVAGFLGAGRGPALPDSGGVLVAGSGDRYVVVDGRLHPALNLASALLVGGGKIAEVRPSVLDGLPRGLPIGIPDAPDALPPPDRLTTQPWTVCAVPSGAATLPPQVTLRVGAPEPTAGVLDAGQAVLAIGPDRVLWMLNQGRRYRLLDNAAVRLRGRAEQPAGAARTVARHAARGPADRGAGDRRGRACRCPGCPTAWPRPTWCGWAPAAGRASWCCATAWRRCPS